jgi:hypothetical protein
MEWSNILFAPNRAALSFNRVFLYTGLQQDGEQLGVPWGLFACRPSLKLSVRDMRMFHPFHTRTNRHMFLFAA